MAWSAPYNRPLKLSQVFDEVVVGVIGVKVGHLKMPSSR